MAFKDKFDKLISYFDTDEVSDVEETVEETAPTSLHQKQAESSLQQIQQHSEMVKNSRVQQEQNNNISLQRSQQKRTVENNQVVRTLQQRREEQLNAGQTVMTISLKFPRKYEDAREIVDLLINNECVLIDFQHMLDAQARRCTDYIDGASRVLYGKLEKLSGSMYLLTPSNVVVNIESLGISNNGKDIGFDFDMKRRS